MVRFTLARQHEGENVDATAVEDAILSRLSHGRRQSLNYLCNVMYESAKVADDRTIDALERLVQRGMLVRTRSNDAIWYQLPTHNFK